MANFDDKYFLDLLGLETYDKLIKEYIKNYSSENETVKDINDKLAELAQFVETQTPVIEKHTEDIATNASAISALEDAVDVLNGDADTEGSVAAQVKKAVDDLVNGAPEALDTLKEIADWIADDEEGTKTLLDKLVEMGEDIEALEQANEDLKAYSDKQDAILYDSIKAIEQLKIENLFPVMQAEGQSVAQAIEALPEGKALKLEEGQEISEDLVINKSCYIDANGATFTGTVTVPAAADIIIENAVFSNPVVLV